MLTFRGSHPRSIAVGSALIGMVTGAVVAIVVLGPAGGAAAPAPPAGRPVAGFSKVVYLSHLNDPKRTPGFPGDPRFFATTAFTVPTDGYYLQYVQEGEPPEPTGARPATSTSARCAPVSSRRPA